MVMAWQAKLRKENALEKGKEKNFKRNIDAKVNTVVNFQRKRKRMCVDSLLLFSVSQPKSNTGVAHNTHDIRQTPPLTMG